MDCAARLLSTVSTPPNPPDAPAENCKFSDERQAKLIQSVNKVKYGGSEFIIDSLLSFACIL